MSLTGTVSRWFNRKGYGFIRCSGSVTDSSVNLTTRAWVKAEDYWSVHYSMNENVYKTFNAKGISIPYPQMDVHLHK